MTDWGLFFQNLLAAGVARGTPILFAALGETLAERSGVLNLGIEGMMLVGAMSGVAAASATGSVLIGLVAAMAAATVLAVVHAVLCVSFRADAVVSGLSLVLLGTGLSAVAGAPLVALGSAVPHLAPVPIPLLSDLPVVGPVLFEHTLLAYMAMLLPVAVWFYVHRTRPGLNLLAAGENPEAARAMGIPVRRLRYVHVAAGGAFAGLAGASLSLAITPGWVEGMTAGQGWIALGLVIFARWNPLYVAAGALLFGVVRRLPLDLQGTDIAFFRDPNLGYFLNMLPYLVTVGVLVVSRIGGRAGTGQPAGLNRPVE